MEYLAVHVRETLEQLRMDATGAMRAAEEYLAEAERLAETVARVLVELDTIPERRLTDTLVSLERHAHSVLYKSEDIEDVTRRIHDAIRSAVPVRTGSQ